MRASFAFSRTFSDLLDLFFSQSRSKLLTSYKRSKQQQPATQQHKTHAARLTPTNNKVKMNAHEFADLEPDDIPDPICAGSPGLTDLERNIVIVAHYVSSVSFIYE